MSFAEALTDHRKAPDDVAELAPSHLIVVDAYCTYSESHPQSTLMSFFKRLVKVLGAPNCRTRLIDLGFMDLRMEDLGTVEAILTLPSVRFVDLRRGNFSLHTDEALRMIHEVISHCRISRVYIYLCDLSESLRLSPKIMCVDDDVLFEDLVQGEPHQANGAQKPKPTGSPLRRNPGRAFSTEDIPMPPEFTESIPQNRKYPQNMHEALEVFRQHGITPAQMFESPESIDSLLSDLQNSRKDQWHDIVDASRLIHQVLPISVVHWARKTLRDVGMWTCIYNKTKLDDCYQSIPDRSKRSMIERCISVMRRHIGMVLQGIGFNEAEAQTKMDSLRKRVESYKTSRRYDDADELEEVMELVIDWRPEFGSTCKEAVDPPKVDYQVVKRVR